MKFIFADCLDYVDPRYDFEKDEHGERRQPYWDDLFPHEILGHAPYDGILVSRAIVGDHRSHGKYSEAQSMRFRRVGARTFFRLNKPQFRDKSVFGDCGTFSYARESEPPYGPSDTVEFYADGGFTHGCSIDHIIFEFNPNHHDMSGGSEESRHRFDITLELAELFLKESQQLGRHFTPVGVIQGWSPDSMAESARRLLTMGYRYLAIGGLVPLKVDAVHQAVSRVHNAVGNKSDVQLHLLGFAKADHLREFTRYNKIASFDTTSPLIRAFKDARRNYYLPNGDGTIHYYTAIRIPQAHENNRLKRQVQSGSIRQENLVSLEQRALSLIRAYDRGKANIDETLDAIMQYSRPLLSSPSTSEELLEQRLISLRQQYQKTLKARPWTRCQCAICRTSSVEVAIFRSSNRNKRRGIHNLDVFYQHLKRIYTR